MNRFDCGMIEFIGKTAYCGYFGVAYMECFSNKNCPEEEEDGFEDEDNEEIYEDY